MGICHFPIKIVTDYFVIGWLHIGRCSSNRAYKVLVTILVAEAWSRVRRAIHDEILLEATRKMKS